jgi:hypothetical protein
MAETFLSGPHLSLGKKKNQTEILLILYCPRKLFPKGLVGPLFRKTAPAHFLLPVVCPLIGCSPSQKLLIQVKE